MMTCTEMSCVMFSAEPSAGRYYEVTAPQRLIQRDVRQLRGTVSMPSCSRGCMKISGTERSCMVPHTESAAKMLSSKRHCMLMRSTEKRHEKIAQH